jgi:HYR domain-containing protein
MHKLAGRPLATRALLFRTLVALGLAVLVGAAGSNWPARAQTNRFVSPFGNDNPGFDNDCTDPEQPCATIQHAINESGAGDLIELAPGTYVENVTVSQSVTIQGDGTVSSTVDGNNAAPVFIVNTGVTATLNTLTITRGVATDSSNNRGAGIQNSGTLTVFQSTITDNEAATGSNQAQGGGIFNSGTLTIINSTISANQSISIVPNAVGGGIYNLTSATATVVNSTISNNVAATVAGGIYNAGTLNLTNTIISGNERLFPLAEEDCVNQGTIGTNSHNLIQDGSCSPAVSGDPKLGPLQNNGGPTFTHALMAGSPAIDAGDDAVTGDPFNLEFDQRSFGFPRKSCAHVDIGAYEFGSATPPTITCPGNISASTDPGQTTATVSFTTTATDSCDGALTPVCMIGPTVITSPHQFPAGVAVVTCTTINSAGLTAMCSFTVSVTSFNFCIQDDSTRDTLRFNSMTGQYVFTRCATGFTLTGTGVVTIKGSTITLQHVAPDRRVSATLDNSTHRGSASVQVFAPTTTFMITDRNTLNDTCACQ